MKRRHRGHHWQLLDERIYKRPLLHRFSAAVEFYKQWNTSAKCPFTLLYRRRNFIAHRRGNKSDRNASVPRLLPILAICVCSRYGTNTRSDHRVDVPVETPLARQVGLISSWLVRGCPSWIFFFQDTVASIRARPLVLRAIHRLFFISFPLIETVWNVTIGPRVIVTCDLFSIFFSFSFYSSSFYIYIVTSLPLLLDKVTFERQGIDYFNYYFSIK